MIKYHINPETGDVSQCEAGKGKCPFYEEYHYSNYLDARNAAEKMSENLAKEKQRKDKLIEAYQRYGNTIRPFTMNFSSDVKKLLNTLKDHGFRPLLAGGAVRDAVTNENNKEDSVLYIDSKDLDFEVYLENLKNPSDITSKNATEKLIEAARKVGNVDEVGKSFGVLKMTLKDGTDIDLSLPRKESKTGSGHTGFDIEPDITMKTVDASARRDFTLNSMMYDNETKVLIDPHNGLKDLKNKRLRHTSSAFAEDPLRVMRAFQFASRFGLKLDKETVHFSRSLYSEFDSISEERIQTEWDKWSAKGKKPSSGLKVLQDTGWDKGFAGLKESNHAKTRNAVDKAAELCDKDHTLDRRVILPAVIAANMQDPKNRKKFIENAIIGIKSQRRALALSATADTEDHTIGIEDIDSVSKAKEAALDTRTSLRERLALYKALSISDDTADNSYRDEKISQIEQYIENGKVWDSPEKDLINGNDLLSLTDKKPGRWMSEIISSLKVSQARGMFTNKKEALEYSKKLLKE